MERIAAEPEIILKELLKNGRTLSGKFDADSKKAYDSLIKTQKRGLL